MLDRTHAVESLDGEETLVGFYDYPTPPSSTFPASEVNVTRTVPVFFHVIQSSMGQAPLDLVVLGQQVALLNQRYGTPPRNADGSVWSVPRYQFTG